MSSCAFRSRFLLVFLLYTFLLSIIRLIGLTLPHVFLFWAWYAFCWRFVCFLIGTSVLIRHLLQLLLISFLFPFVCSGKLIIGLPAAHPARTMDFPFESLSRHSGQSKLYDELPVCAATDSMLCFFSSFPLRVFAIILFFDIIDATFCHSKGGESMYRRAFPVIDPVATGKNIVRLRQARGMTVKDLQQWFGFEEPRAIYKWQQGQSLPSVDNLIALSVLLDVPVEDILVCHYPHSQLNSPISLGRQDHSCRPFYFRLSGKRRHTSGTSAILQYVSGKFAASCFFAADKLRILHKELQRWSRPSYVSFHIMRRELGWLDDRITREQMDAERLSV